MKALILCLLLTGCMTVSQVLDDVRLINQVVNAAPADDHKSVTDDWQGLAKFKGGNCYQKARQMRHAVAGIPMPGCSGPLA